MVREPGVGPLTRWVRRTPVSEGGSGGEQAAGAGQESPPILEIAETLSVIIRKPLAERIFLASRTQWELLALEDCRSHAEPCHVGAMPCRRSHAL